MRQVLDCARGINLNGGLSRQLAHDGIRLVTTTSNEPGVRELRELQPDVILLGISDNGNNTTRVCAEIRRETAAGLLVLSTGYCETSAVELLDSGADDYLIFDGNYSELAARIRALLRRTARVSEQRVLSLGDLIIDAENRIVHVADREVTLTPLELRLLVCLAANNGRSLSPGTLIRAVQGYVTSDQEATHIIKALVWRLRKKIEVDPSNPQYIRNVRGAGYILDRRNSPLTPRHTSQLKAG